MRITSIQTNLYRVPPTIRISDSIQSIHTWEWIITSIHTDAGLTGTGWSYTLGMGGSGLRSIIDDYLAPILVGYETHQIEQIWKTCWEELHANGSGGFTTLAIAPIDIALWDLAAQQRGLPLYKLLGGARDSIPAYGSGINMHLEGQQLADQMREFLDSGYGTVKIKVGRDDPMEDVERVATVRNTIGPTSNYCWMQTNLGAQEKLFAAEKCWKDLVQPGLKNQSLRMTLWGIRTHAPHWQSLLHLAKLYLPNINSPTTFTQMPLMWSKQTYAG